LGAEERQQRTAGKSGGETEKNGLFGQLEHLMELRNGDFLGRRNTGKKKYSHVPIWTGATGMIRKSYLSERCECAKRIISILEVST